MIDLSVHLAFLKSVNVRKRMLLVQTGKKNVNLVAEIERYRALLMTTISKC